MAASRRELDGVGQEVDQDLVQAPLVGHELRQVVGHMHLDLDLFFSRLQQQQVVHFLDGHQNAQRLVVDFAPPGFDARQIENVVDEGQQIVPGMVDVVGVILVDRNGHWPEHLALQDLRKAHDGIERRAQFMAHGGEEGRLRLVGFLGPLFFFFGLGLFAPQVSDEAVLLRTENQHVARRFLKIAGHQQEEGFKRHDGAAKCQIDGFGFPHAAQRHADGENAGAGDRAPA